ncbi:MAG: DUF3035 domain-containing protein [Pseudomonadota bacterium]
MTSKDVIRACGALLLLTGLAGCSQAREILGYNKQAPDEFQVYARAPLSLPPDYNLRPPAPGAPRPQEGTARDQAASAVFGDYAFGGSLGQALGEKPDPGSNGEKAFLQSAGATGIDPSIRQTIDTETAALIEQDKSLIDSLIFWRKPELAGTVVDPTKETQRLQENAALGLPVTEGETPTIERKKKALLEGIF